MKIIIGSRQSHLARLQALTTGEALQRVVPELEIEYLFKKSLGDIQDTDTLYKMPEKGVFTEDFVADLLESRVDLVVHSWKDLPTQRSAETEVVATLPREDPRDLLLLRKDLFLQWSKLKQLRVLCSSPRRVYNLSAFLPWALPQPAPLVEFKDVRGNIPTRLKKLFHEHQGEALVVAKAALDRLLGTGIKEFEPLQREIRELLENALIMVLPLSENPSAAAQGALAIEIKKDRTDLRQLLQKIHCENTFKNVVDERKILSFYGGGCHQKIGVSIESYGFGVVKNLRGLTDAGEVLRERSLDKTGRKTWFERNQLAQSSEHLWPTGPNEAKLFSRVHLPTPKFNVQSQAFYLARAEAIPEELKPEDLPLLWSSGLQSWRKLAQRGFWVSGSQDALGDFKPHATAVLWPQMHWLKVTHRNSYQFKDLSYGHLPELVSYELQESLQTNLSLSSKTHFFWMSASSYEVAVRRCPQIAKAFHGCGPGLTFDYLTKVLPKPEEQLAIFLDFNDWKKKVLAKE